MSPHVKKSVMICLLLMLGVHFSGTPALHAQDFDKYLSSSLYTDFKAKTVGDIVTIMIIESTTGSQATSMSGSEKSKLKSSGKITGNLTRFLPKFSAEADFQNDNSGKAASQQEDALTGKITAVVTEISDNGNLTLLGKRKLEVNGETYLLNIKGTARQKDISSDNVVLSYNLANVEIAYKKDGLINKLGKPPFIARWTTWALMAGLTASAYWVLGVAGK